MKKTLILAALSLAAVVSCQKNKVEITDVPTPAEEEAWMADESLPVPIQFSTSMTVDTKATPVGTLQNLNGLDLGLYALAVSGSYTLGGTNNKTPNWYDTQDRTFIFKNLKVTTNSEDGSITIDDYFYPIGNSNAFSFYGYYPYSEGAVHGSAAGVRSYSVTYDLGTTDILFAESHATTYTDNLEGFNAKYIRAVKANGVFEYRKPVLNFKHVLTSLQIQARDKGLDNEADNPASRLRIISVSLTDIPTKGTLTIANSSSVNGGTITGSVPGTIALTKVADGAVAAENSTDFSSTVLYKNAVALGEFLVIPASEYKLSIVYQMTNAEGTLTGPEGTITSTISGNFLAGNRYKVNLSIEPGNIEIDTQYTPWVDGSEIDAPLDYGN